MLVEGSTSKALHLQNSCQMQVKKACQPSNSLDNTPDNVKHLSGKITFIPWYRDFYVTRPNRTSTDPNAPAINAVQL